MEYKILRIDNDGEDEADYPVAYCPVCGSTTITSFGAIDPLFNLHKQEIGCETCDWSVIIFIKKQGYRKFKIRQDERSDAITG